MKIPGDIGFRCATKGCTRKDCLMVEKRSGAIVCPVCAVKMAQREAFLKGVQVGLNARAKSR